MIEIIVSLIGFAGVITVQIYQSKQHNNILEERLKSTKVELNSKIESLEEKVDMKIDNLASDVQKHNDVITRTFALEKSVALLEMKVG